MASFDKVIGMVRALRRHGVTNGSFQGTYHGNPDKLELVVLVTPGRDELDTVVKEMDAIGYRYTGISEARFTCDGYEYEVTMTFRCKKNAV